MAAHGNRARGRTRLTTALAITLSTAGLSSCDPIGAPVELGSVSEAPAHFEAKRLSFRGELRPELIGSHSWRNRSPNGRGNGATGSELFMFVVPVVPEGWTPDQPVPMWLTPPSKASRGGDPSAWLEEAKAVSTTAVVGKVMDYAGREPGFRTGSGWQKAIVQASAAHDIHSDPHAPVVMWPAPE